MLCRAVALGLLLLFAGCRDQVPLRVGVVMGGDGSAAARLAAADVNAAGGIDGAPLELEIVPAHYATSAQPAIHAADSLAADATILAVVGHSNSSASLAASQVYNARGLTHIAPTTTTPLFSRAGPHSFRLVPDDARQAELLSDVALAAGTSPRVAVIYVNDDYGRALFELLAERLASGRAQLVYEAPYLEGGGSRQLESAATAAAEAAPDLLFWLGRAPDLRAFLVPLRERLPTLRVVASDGVDGAPVYAQPDRFRGIRFVRFLDPASPAPGLQELRRRYRAETRQEISSEAVFSYDAVMLLAEALRSGARTREEVRAYLASLGRERPPYPGLGGEIAFDEEGDVLRPYHLAEIGPAGVRAIPLPVGG